ncbi:SMI1/KNR4 family protein [Larsenimonas rhizosphaerae]|uniref:SMI1/KNR4 family protein n=1 Tax=Larsenimonas rhizosphaerae TaxID=2944682 RepID=UPI002033DBB4|nr:SMI1/KNR4 family protein [Larsenimonas rhizosphaerae]MCM2129773.1 SMI1/KNR4 family protein [Larsenimonas rhizosphaerae]
MALIDVFKGIDLAVEHGFEIDLEGKKPASLIEAAEQALGIVFPPSYRDFLLSFGCGDIAGHEFYGVIGPDFSNSGIPDAIWLTLRERVDSNLPSRLVVVSAGGDGSYYSLDCGRVSDDKECPVIIWWPSASEEENLDKNEVLFKDFGVFFLDRIRSSL